ncbi:UNKNOWN [Stylonychia lemnae]|uniref:Uncharacterized protein n=1 Tax=Stylonychia lemnae TaxID=5949 RepID=A0A078AA86_STYLE|nr:UNKNOWN [Stylonychia lemnae]|eukprot:CDW78482.1 UNKNOWN [Stylonychia lemnae]
MFVIEAKVICNEVAEVNIKSVQSKDLKLYINIMKCMSVKVESKVPEQSKTQEKTSLFLTFLTY